MGNVLQNSMTTAEEYLEAIVGNVKVVFDARLLDSDVETFVHGQKDIILGTGCQPLYREAVTPC